MKKFLAAITLAYLKPVWLLGTHYNEEGPTLMTAICPEICYSKPLKDSKG